MRRIFGAAALLAMSGSPVMAATHTVIITGLGYFPETLYIQPGDEVEFYNGSEQSEKVASIAVEGAEEDPNAWASESFAIGASFTLLVESNTPLVYFDPETPELTGTMSFDAPPVGQ